MKALLDGFVGSIPVGLCDLIVAQQFSLVNTSFEKRTSPQKRACRYSFRVNYHLAFVGLLYCVICKLCDVFVFTPKTKVGVSSFAGALIITFFAPCLR